MAEYIEKATVLSKCEEMWNDADETTQTGVDTINAIDKITDFIEAMPIADVQPIVYAHKTINVGRRSYCSNCGKLAIMEDYCSKCGAKVRDGDTNGY